MECRVLVDGAQTSDTFDAAAIATVVAGGKPVWIDLVDPKDTDVRALLEAIPELKADAEPERMMRRGRPPRVKVVGSLTFIRMYGVTPSRDAASQEIVALCSDHFLITLRYRAVYDLDPVFRRWAQADDRRTEGGKFMVSLVLEECVDDYFDVIDQLEAATDDLEGRVFDLGAAGEKEEAATVQKLQADVQRRRSELAKFRRLIMPFGEVRELTQDRGGTMSEQLVLDFRDVADSVLRAVELLDNVRDQLTSAFESALAQVSNELNQTMKKLTSWAAILLVPTLIAGIYGMNFPDMPEFKLAFGYPAAILVMAGSALTLYLVFKKKEWL